VKLPLLTGRQVLAALQRLGFVEIDRRGSHVKLEHPDAWIGNGQKRVNGSACVKRSPERFRKGAGGQG